MQQCSCDSFDEGVVGMLAVERARALTLSELLSLSLLSLRTYSPLPQLRQYLYCCTSNASKLSTCNSSRSRLSPRFTYALLSTKVQILTQKWQSPA